MNRNTWILASFSVAFAALVGGAVLYMLSPVIFMLAFSMTLITSGLGIIGYTLRKG